MEWSRTHAHCDTCCKSVDDGAGVIAGLSVRESAPAPQFMVVLGTKNRACRPRSRGRREAQQGEADGSHFLRKFERMRAEAEIGGRHCLFEDRVSTTPDVSLPIAGKCSLNLGHARYAFTCRTWIEPGARGLLCCGANLPFSIIA